MASTIAAPPDDPDRDLATFNALKPRLDAIFADAKGAGWRDWEIASAIMHFGVSETVRLGLSDADAARVLGEAITLRDELLNGF